MSDPLHSTALHEAGHAVAVLLLFGDLCGRIKALGIKEDGGGTFDVAKLVAPTEDEIRHEAIVYYSGWAAVRAHGYCENEALRGTEPDFAFAQRLSHSLAGDPQAEALKLMLQPDVAHCVEYVATELLEHRYLDGNHIRQIFWEASAAFAKGT